MFLDYYQSVMFWVFGIEFKVLWRFDKGYRVICIIFIFCDCFSNQVDCVERILVFQIFFKGIM